MKKAQIKMFESIGVLLVFFFLVGFGLQFYTNIQLQDLDRAKKEFSEVTSIEIASKITNFPSLYCSEHNVRKTSCIDIEKATIWQDKISEVEGFQSFIINELPPSTLFLNQMYPTKQQWVLYNDTPQFTNESRVTYIDTVIPVTLFNSTSRLHNFGVLVVRLYQ